MYEMLGYQKRGMMPSSHEQNLNAAIIDLQGQLQTHKLDREVIRRQKPPSSNKTTIDEVKIVRRQQK
jgi:hypothetical protein